MEPTDDECILQETSMSGDEPFLTKKEAKEIAERLATVTQLELEMSLQVLIHTD